MEDSGNDQNPDTLVHSPSQQPPPIKEKNKQVATGQDEDDDDKIEKILKRLTRDRFIEILKVAASRDTKIRDIIKREADCASLHRQIFVRSDDAIYVEALADYFKRFGEVLGCKTSHDRDSGLYYGFILFKNRSDARKALKVRIRCIGETYVYCDIPEKDNFTERAAKKVYVCNIKEEMNVDQLTEIFSKFGEIEEGPLGVDRITGRIKGHCCFVYKTRESAMEAIKEPEKKFGRYTLHCLLLDSYLDASDGDPEPEKLPSPSLPSTSRLLQGATDYDAGRGTNASLARAHGYAGANQNPIVTPPGHQAPSTPSSPPEPENPPDTEISPTNPASVLQFAADNNAEPRSANVEAGAGQNQQGVKRWTREEHELFLKGIKSYGRGKWKAISETVLKTRTPLQICSHAQKFFNRQKIDRNQKKRKTIHDFNQV